MRRQVLPCDASGATAGRHAMAAALAVALRPTGLEDRAKDDDLVYEAGLVATELMSNAVRACRSRIVLQLDVHHDRVRIGVWDDGPGVPVERTAGGNDVGGRGLRIIASLSTSWGTTASGSGKSVWAEMPIVSSSAGHLNCVGRRT